jgi:hypothetical protein
MAKKLTSSKAKEILHDKSVHGHPLTDKQRRFFGAIAGGAKPIAQNGIEGTMGGLTDVGFDYNGAWGGTMAMGGSLPGSVGFTYARTQSPAPSNGPYAKKTKASAQNGMEMKYYQEGLDWKPKSISKDGGWLDKFQDGTPGSGLSPVSIDKSVMLPEIVIQDRIPKRIQDQNVIIQKTKPEKNYSIVDKGKNLIYYYDPAGELITIEQIITGASNKDSDVAPSMREYFEKNNTSNHEEYFNYLKSNQLQTTPSGIFTISGMRENTAQNPDKLGSFFNKTFRPEREKEIENIRLQDYGEQQKLLTLMSEYGVPSSKAIHGTGREERLAAFEKGDADGRNLSNGCINVNGETVCFDTLEKGSSVYVLPEEGEKLLYPNEKNKSKKGTNKVYTKTKSNIADALTSRGIKFSKDALDFISSVAEKETKGGRSKFAKLEKYTPYALANSQGMFQINPDENAFGKYIPKDFDNSLETSVEAVYNFYNDFKDLDPVQKYRKYTGDKKGIYDKAFKRIYDRMSNVYKEGGVIEDDRGQWAHPGEITKINSNQITMQGVDYPVLGISDTGDTKMMQPGEDYKFKGKSVTEYPMAQDGITRGGYDDPDYVTGTSRRAFNKMVGMGNYLVPANAINSAADLAKKKGLDYGAITSGPADAVRHAAAAASVASRLPVPKFIGKYSPDLDRAIRIAGANLLGIGNEIMSPNSEGLWMDIKNNYQGSLIGSIPGLNQNDRNKMIINQLQKGKLTVDNPKKPKKENGGWLNKYK